MAITYSDYTGDGSNTDFAFSFPYLEDTHVVVEVDGIDKTTTAGDFTLPTTSLVRMTVAPALAADVRVKRVSDFATDLVDFTNGSVLTEGDLDRAYQHNRYLNEEAAEGNDASMQIVGGGTDYNAANKKIVNLADPTVASDASNKDYVDTQVALSGTNLNSFDKSTHTGDNTETEFTLSFTSQVTTPEAYLVTIDGVVQTPTTAYTVNTTTNKITFTSAPPTSAAIVVVPMGTTTVASEASVVATGSTTARTLATRVADVVNVLDYGAVSTETTVGFDSTAEIQAAIDAAKVSGAEVYFPAGEYLISGAGLTLEQNGVHLRGAGRWQTKLTYNGTGSAIAVTDGITTREYCSIRDLGFVCNNTTANTAIDLDKAPTTVLKNIYISEYNVGVYAKSAWNTTCDNIFMRNIRTKGFFFETNCNDTGFINCVVDGADEASSRGLYAESCHGISWKGGAIEDFEYAFEFQACEVTIDCYVESNDKGVIYVPTGTATQINVLNMYSFGNAPGEPLFTMATGFIKVQQLNDQTSGTQPTKIFNLTGGAKAYYGDLIMNSAVKVGTCDPTSGGKIKPLYETPTTRYVSPKITVQNGVTETFYIGNVFRPWKIGSIRVVQLAGTLTGSSMSFGTNSALTEFCSAVTLVNDASPPATKSVAFTQTSGSYTNQTGPLVFSLTGSASQGGATATVQVIIDYYMGYAATTIENLNDINTFLTTNGGNGESIPMQSLI